MKALPLLALCLAACVSSANSTKLTKNTYPERPKGCQIEVLVDSPEREHENVGLVTGTSGQHALSSKDLDSMLPSMKNEACALGAHALILKDVEEGGVAWIQATQGKASAVAIRYTETLPGDPWAPSSKATAQPATSTP